MLGALKQLAVYYPYSVNSYQTPTTSHSPIPAGILAAIIAVSVVLVAAVIVSYWKVFQKAGRPGWASLIPFYNSWVLAEIGGKPGWWGLFPLLGFIPLIGGLISLVIYCIICAAVAERFGKSAVWGVFALAIFTIIGFPMLAFGKATYTAEGPAGADPAYPSVPGSSAAPVFSSPVVSAPEGGQSPTAQVSAPQPSEVVAQAPEATPQPPVPDSVTTPSVPATSNDTKPEDGTNGTTDAASEAPKSE